MYYCINSVLLSFHQHCHTKLPAPRKQLVNTPKKPPELYYGSRVPSYIEICQAFSFWERVVRPFLRDARRQLPVQIRRSHLGAASQQRRREERATGVSGPAWFMPVAHWCTRATRWSLARSRNRQLRRRRRRLAICDWIGTAVASGVVDGL